MIDRQQTAKRSLRKRECLDPAVAASLKSRGRILIVEDEPEIMEPLAHSLQQAEFTVLCAADGLTACRAIGQDDPDVVLLDIMLPDLDGWEVCKLLRQHPDPSVAGTPVIMLTALNSPRDKYRGLELGADAFLPKPYAIREVILLVDNLVKRHKQARALEERLKAFHQKKHKSLDLHHLLFHELRNQLLILNGYTQLLHKDPDQQRAQTCKEAIYRSSNYLQTLAEEVLLIRQVEDGHLALQKEAFDMSKLIDEIVSLYSTPAQGKKMQLVYERDSQHQRVILNRTATKIILSALVDNSIKFGAAGQKITIRHLFDQDRQQLVVTDQGPGIAEEDLGRIFEPYFRASRSVDQTAGSGIGLHAVHVLSQAMGGEITIDSTPGRGSSFRIAFPGHGSHQSSGELS
jgi:two-component system sensor histidine kinase/response regulator